MRRLPVRLAVPRYRGKRPRRFDRVAGALTMEEQQRHELTVLIILRLAGVDYLDIGQCVELDNGYYIKRVEGGVFIGGGR